MMLPFKPNNSGKTFRPKKLQKPHFMPIFDSQKTSFINKKITEWKTEV